VPQIVALKKSVDGPQRGREKAPTAFTAADQRLLGFLARVGKLTPSEVEAAKTACRGSGVSALHFLAEETALPENEVAQTVAQGLGLPLVDLATLQVDEWVASLIEEGVAQRFALVAIGADDETLTLVMANPFDQEAIKFVEFATSRRVRRTVGTRSPLVVHPATGHWNARSTNQSRLGVTRSRPDRSKPPETMSPMRIE